MSAGDPSEGFANALLEVKRGICGKLSRGSSVLLSVFGAWGWWFSLFSFDYLCVWSPGVKKVREGGSNVFLNHLGSAYWHSKSYS